MTYRTQLEKPQLDLRQKTGMLAQIYSRNFGSVPPFGQEILEYTSYTFKERGPRPRVPAGSPDGGEWEPGGGDKHPGAGSGLRLAPDKATQKRAKAIYGETSGLMPKLIDPKSSPYNRSNWDAASTAQLSTARTYIGIVSDRNLDVNYSQPSNGNNPIQNRTWSDAIDAAINGRDGSELDSHVTNFFLRQEGVGRQIPPWRGLHLYESLGPFINVGGGDVPKGPNTYIDFYGK